MLLWIELNVIVVLELPFLVAGISIEEWTAYKTIITYRSKNTYLTVKKKKMAKTKSTQTHTLLNHSIQERNFSPECVHVGGILKQIGVLRVRRALAASLAPFARASRCRLVSLLSLVNL